MDTSKLYSFNSSTWLKLLQQEYEEEVKAEACWRTVLLRSPGRDYVWSMCYALGVCDKGVPGSTCSLIEKYLSRVCRNFLQVERSPEHWNRFKKSVSDKRVLLIVSCAQLAAKMSDLQTPLNASSVRSTLQQLGMDYTIADIVEMEYNVFRVLDYRIPIWNSFETAAFLAEYVGLKTNQFMKALEVIMNINEFHLDEFVQNLRNWISHTRSSRILPPSVYRESSLPKLHVCGACVLATAHQLGHPGALAAGGELAGLLAVDRRLLRVMARGVLYSVAMSSPYWSSPKRRRFF